MGEWTFAEFLGQLLVGLILAVLVGAGSLIITIILAVWKFWQALRPRIEDGEKKLGEIEDTFERFVEYVRQKLERNDEVHSALDHKLDRIATTDQDQDQRIRRIENDCSRLAGECDARHEHDGQPEGEEKP